VKLDVRALPVMLQRIFKFLGKLHREDHTFLMGIDESTFMDLP
jgi:hypothetical protein